jgi:hypothetical protein
VVRENGLVSMQDDEPELAGYDPTDNRPLRSRRTMVIIRVFVVIGLICLVVPGIITTISVGSRTAQAECAIWVRYANPASPGSEARFEIFGAGGIGWECYTQGAFGGDEHVASLGLIPGAPRLPDQRPVDS